MKREKMQTARTKSGFIKHLRNNWMLYAMLLPVLLWYAIFCYLPMGGISLAFKNYQYDTGLWHSPWVGVTHFQKMFGDAELDRKSVV